jgi:hypothetical protein
MLKSTIVSGADKAATLARAFAEVFQDVGGDPDARLEWLLEDRNVRKVLADAAIRCLFKELPADSFQMEEEPPNGAFASTKLGVEDQLRITLEENFDPNEGVVSQLPHYGVASDLWMTHCHRPAKRPGGVTFHLLEVMHPVMPTEIRSLLRYLKFGPGCMYDLVRLRHHPADQPIIAPGSETRSTMFQTAHPMVLGRTMSFIGRGSVENLKPGDRLLVWRKK